MKEFASYPVAPFGVVRISARRYIVARIGGSSRSGDSPYRTPLALPESEPLTWADAQTECRKLNDRLV
jgi:hypothetical protein